MAKLFQVTCLVLLLGMIYGWHSSYFFNEPFLSTSFDDDWFPSSEFDDINEMMEKSREDFRQMFNFSPSFFMTNNEEMTGIKKKLDSISPVCTTTENLPTTKTIQQYNRRKQFRITNTTICIKELINDGMKYIYKETKITDNQDKIISQSNSYQSFTINVFNDTTPSNSTE
jgi:hypothetical protein